MRIDKAQTLKMVGRAGLSIVRSIVVFTLLGTLLSWALLALVYGDLGSLCGPAPAGEEAASAGFRGCAESYIVGGLLLIGFPIAFFFVGQAYGTQQALHGLYSENRPALASYLTGKLMDDLEKSRLNPERYAREQAQADRALSYLRRLDNMPFGVRSIFRFLVRRVDVGEILQRALEAPEGQRLDRELLEPKLAELVTTQLDQQVGERLAPTQLPLWGVLATLAVIVGYVKFILG